MNKADGKKIRKIIRRIIIAAVLFPTICLIDIQSGNRSNKPQSSSVPRGLASLAVSKNSVQLTWMAPSAAVTVVSYQIFKGSIHVADTKDTTVTVSGLNPGTSYTFSVKAKLKGGILSPASRAVKVTTACNASAPAKVAAGYYASWMAYSGYTPLEIPVEKLTAINYAFAQIGNDNKIAFGDSYIDPINFTKLKQLKIKNPQLKTLISVGGEEFSSSFSNMAFTAANRAVFAHSVADFIKKYGFDGVDIDWEYPVNVGGTLNVKEQDKQYFVLLLQTLRSALDVQGEKDGHNYLLTIAGGIAIVYINNINLAAVAKCVNCAYVMTYDVHGPWDPYADFNSPLYDPTEVSPQYKWSMDAAVKAWVAKGFPASKIVAGVPFYGYIYGGITDGRNGLYGKYTSHASAPYDTIVSQYLKDPKFKRYWHSYAKVPWLFNGSQFVTYDNAQSLAAKAGYAHDRNLAGVFVWELSENRDGSLLNALDSGLKGS